MAASPLQTMEDTVYYPETYDEFHDILDEAGDGVVVAVVLSPNYCDSGLDEEAEVQWQAERRAQMDRCSHLDNSFHAVAADCPDIQFVEFEVLSKDDAICEDLGVSVVPSIQFWRGGRKVWEHQGVLGLEQELAEGVLYYGDTGANNEKASQHVVELHTHAQVDAFVAAQPEPVLAVVQVSVEVCLPCMHIYPTVLALAKAFKGYAAFGRLIGDEGTEYDNLLAELHVEEVPTFIFYRGGQEVGRFTGSARGDLVGHILRLQEGFGIAPPAAPARPRRPRQARSTAARR